MIFLRARSYDTSLGRFTTRDPAVLSPMQPVNPYAYAGNDPVNITDPRGTCFLPVGCGELHHVASAFDTARHDIAHYGDVTRHELAHYGDIARHDTAHYFDVVRHEIATHPLIDAIVGVVIVIAAALLAPEVVLAALAVIEEIAEIALEVLEIIEIALEILALLQLILILGKVAKQPPKPYRVLLQAQGPRRGVRTQDVVEQSVPLAEYHPITVREGVTGLNDLKDKLTPGQLKERAQPFRRAEAYIRSGPPAGHGPPGLGFPVRTGSPVRVDVQINAGINFTQQ
jgi:hypothetical protein